LVERRGRSLSAVQLLALSFAGLIAVGTIGLLVLPGLYVGPRLSVIDALFTATSAVCVTGLIVVDTATYFTTLGQVWILCLIQLGGLGILTIATTIILAIGRRPALTVHESVGQQAPRQSGTGLRRTLWSVVLLTLAAEMSGAILLWVHWGSELGWGRALGHAVFHAVSAFCNAGFSTFSTSLSGFQRDPSTLGIVAALVVLGGLGFVVVGDLWTRYVRRTTRRLRLHTVLVLAATAVLLVGGALLYYGFEVRNTLAALPPLHRVTNALFMSVTARTAGFNAVGYDAVSDPSVVLTLILMFVGGSPGSTAGGVKTTTIALLAVLFVSYLRGRRHVSVRGRTVPPETVHLATGLIVAGLVAVAVSIFVLMLSEVPGGTTDRVLLVRAAFESVSAFGTVGLSMGLTPALTVGGKGVIVLLMFLGRVGPLTLAASMAIAQHRRRVHYRHAYETVAIG
jgi:trk system potassium uptake protein TrkH